MMCLVNWNSSWVLTSLIPCKILEGYCFFRKGKRKRREMLQGQGWQSLGTGAVMQFCFIMQSISALVWADSLAHSSDTIVLLFKSTMIFCGGVERVFKEWLLDYKFCIEILFIFWFNEAI